MTPFLEKKSVQDTNNKRMADLFESFPAEQ